MGEVGVGEGDMKEVYCAFLFAKYQSLSGEIFKLYTRILVKDLKQWV